MTKAQIDEIVSAFGQARRRAREAELDGVEVHGCNGYLITQFLSPRSTTGRTSTGARSRTALASRSRSCARSEGGRRRLPRPVQDQRDRRREGALPWAKEGTTLEESIHVCKWLVEEGVDGLHVSAGYVFLHPRTHGGTFPDLGGSSVPTTRCSRAGRTPSGTTSCSARRRSTRPSPTREAAACKLGVEDQPRARPRDQAGRRRASSLRRRVPDGVGDRARDRGRLGRRRRWAGP